MQKNFLILNMDLFLSEALGYNKSTYLYIDKVYQKKRYEFYNQAQENTYFNHYILNSGSILQVEYGKKALGIVSYVQKNYDKEIHDDLIEIIKKGWAYVYSYVQSSTEISLEKFYKKVDKRYENLKKVNDEVVFTDVNVLIILADLMNKKICEDDSLQDLFEKQSSRIEYHEIMKKTIPMIIETNKTKINELKRMMHQRTGEISNFTLFLNKFGKHPYLNRIASLFKNEEVSLSVFQGVKYSSIDIDYIFSLFSAFSEEAEIDCEELERFYIDALLVKGFIKVINNLKKQYFQRNQEIIQIEAENLERKLKDANEELEALKNIEAMQSKMLLCSEKRIKALEKQLEKEKGKTDKANDSLVIFVPNYEQSDIMIDFDMLKDKKVAIIGGHQRWHTKMKEVLSNSFFISPDTLNFDTNILLNSEAVFVYTNYLNHGMYYKVMEYAKSKNIKVYYIDHQNTDIVLAKMYKALSA